MATLKNPDASTRAPFGETTEREPGTGRIIRTTPGGRRIVEPDQTALTPGPSEDTPQKPSK